MFVCRLLVDFRAPRLWIFLSSLEEAFFSNLLGRYIAFVPPGNSYLRFTHRSLLLLTMHRLARSCCLILNNPEKNYYQAPQAVQPIVSTR